MNTPPSYNPPHPVYNWFVSLLARAFEIDTLQVNGDPRFVTVRSSVVLNRHGKGSFEGTLIEFEPDKQLVTFHCQAVAQADSIAEAVRASERFQTCVIVEIPQKFF